MTNIHSRSFPLHAMLLALSLMWLPPASGAEDCDIAQLMQLLAQNQSAHSGFVETKSIAILDKPVISSGELFYTAPDHLEKRTLKPKAETMVLDHGTILITRGSKNYRLQLQDYPALAAFIDSIRGTLAGDAATLQRNYTLRLQGAMAHWTLQLLPANEQIKTVVQRISISGEKGELRSIEILQADGDSSVMTITQLAGQ
jgi:outer membrane lipoprotein-sorting protein